MEQGKLFGPQPVPSSPSNRAKEQPEIFATPAENRAIVNKAIDKVKKNTKDEWKEFALELMYRLLLIKKILVIDDFWAELDLVRKGKSQVMQGKVPTPEPNHSVGGWLVREAAKRGWMERSEGFNRSDRKAAHRKLQCVWISLIVR